MVRPPRQQQSVEALSPLQLRKVRKGTRSCWECKRRKIRCTFAPGNTATCVWCFSHGSDCVSQRYQNDTGDHSRSQTLEERMLRLETGDGRKDTEEPLERAITTKDGIGIDVINTVSMMSAPSSNSAFVSEIGGKGTSSTATSTMTPDINTTMWSKLKRVSRLLLEMMPSREAIDFLDGESSLWICQLLRPLPSLKQSNKFSLLKTMPLESASPSHPTVIARALMIIVVCLQQLPKSIDMTQLRLPSPRDEYMEYLTATIISLVASDDEIIATPEGLECLLLLYIYFVNSGRPRRAWLNNRRALAVAQLKGLHKPPVDGIEGDEQSVEANIGGLWPHIVHHDRHLSQILGFPCGVVDTYEPLVSSNLRLICIQYLDENHQDMLYLTRLDRVAALLIEREQRSSTLDMSNHLPFMLDATDERRCEYSRIACLQAARELIKVYLPLRTTFGMFSCCMTNFQAFTAAVILIFNIFLRDQAAELEVLSGQRDADWSLIADVIDALDAAIERFEDRVALQARDVLKLLQTIEKDPKNLEGDRFHFTIPYFGIISIARKLPAGKPGGIIPPMHENSCNRPSVPSVAELSLDYSSEFMTTIDFMGSNTAADVDELMQQWLVEEM
ncbi:hypothetical protein V8C37DRAFT_413164 [Trichoderma ceciliae]